MIDSGLSSLLLDLYACPTNVGRWPQVLDGIRERLRVRCAALQILSTAAPRVRVEWVARDSEAQADQGHYDPFISGDQNPRLRVTPPRVHPSATFMRDRDYFQAGHRDLARLRERLADLGLGSCLSAGISLSAHESLVLVLHRDLKDRRDFSRHDEARVATVMPHLRQAVSLSGHLQSSRQHTNGLRLAVDRMSFGLVLCDAEGKPSWTNQVARRTFRDRDGLWLRQGRLSAASPADTGTLRRAVAEAAHEGGVESHSKDRCLLLSQSEKGSALQVMVVPLRCDATAGSWPGGAMLGSCQTLLMFSRASATPVLAPALVATLFALSPTESRLVSALCQGLTVNEYAAAHRVSVGTARFQLKQVLAKTQARRQSELVRRVCTSVAAHAMRSEG
jgi:DNA-binding CsgD family transcriptional regulator/PAS domain-containing protein